jgi:hypothetical protein
MEPTTNSKYQKLLGMLEAFVAGQNRSIQFVREMDAEFWAVGLNEDERFSDLLMALDMFGVPVKDFGCDERTLATECRHALRVLKEES